MIFGKPNFLALFVFFSFSVAVHAQTNVHFTKKERKEQMKLESDEQRKAILDLLQSREWVIEAHTVFDRHSQSYQLNSSTNFVGVKGEEGALQLGFCNLIGWNGIGGITIDGQVIRYQINQSKDSDNPVINLRFQGRGANAANISITVNTSGQASARLTGDFGDRIIFAGIIRPLDESVVYKGESFF